ncbi:MAG: RdgB/HAM1 family non-canonical purine NTP pyrophosphatase [Candidatus Saganbacteria bacterium]|nr:RdgB/HAM1 family non-canonical purine NTP pyrophosphatase [Candidatus Saganbacteria bacterium]
MDFIIASKNPGKIKEIKHLLKGLKLRISSLLDHPDAPDIRETGISFKENAVKKAVAVARRFNKLTLADDSGLEVRYLKGAPGIRSSRFVRPPITTKKLCTKLLKKLKGVPMKARSARFVCVAAVAKPDGRISVARGTVRGKIALEIRGDHGFGYDPVFIPYGFKDTFGELPPPVKNRLSHRGKAIGKINNILRKTMAH